MENSLLENRCPQLLVSVRDSKEAIAALEGGCDILDIKEPQHGSLGMANISTIHAIVTNVHEQDSTIPISAALGEVVDWSDSINIPKLPPKLSFVKLGLSGLSDCKDWTTRWNSVRNHFEKAAKKQLNWIAVAYADWRNANAPHPLEILKAASEHSTAGLLIDTHSKSAGPLFEQMSPEELSEIAKLTRNADLKLAVAGSIQEKMLADLSEIGSHPDIVAIRTAACRNRNRSGEVTSEAVQEFKNAMTAAFRDSEKQTEERSASLF